MTGWGQVSQETCRTNGKGPEIYTKCAAGSFYEHRGKIKKIKHLTESNGRQTWNCMSGFSLYTISNDIKELNLNLKIEDIKEMKRKHVFMNTVKRKIRHKTLKY